MDILILGNGFDIAHGLLTKYSDFLDYCTKKYSIDKKSGVIYNPEAFTNNLWLRHFISVQSIGNKWIDLEKEIYSVIKNLDKKLQDITFEYSQPHFPYEYIYLENQIEKDFNLSRIIHKLRRINLENTYENFMYRQNIQNQQVCSFTNYKEFIQFLYDHLREFTKEFNKYLTNEILPQIGKKKFYYSLSNNTSIRILNFNYTNTYEKLYNTHSLYTDTNPKFVYIHGKACNSENCNLVLGTHSFFNRKPNDLNEEIGRASCRERV